MAINLPKFPQFDCADLSNAGPRWKKWLARFDVMMLAMNIKDTEEEKERKKALLLHYMGDECYDIYETLMEDEDKYEEVRSKMSNYFVPKANAEYEKYLFRNTKQKEDETLDQFCTRLKKIAVNCGFTNDQFDSEVKSQIIQGCLSSQLRKKALSKPLDLKTLLETGKAMELADSQLSTMESDPFKAVPESVSKVKRDVPVYSNPKRGWKKSQPAPVATERKKTCFRCGGTFPHEKHCPAKNRKCFHCSGLGHYAKFCRKRGRNTNVFPVNDAAESDLSLNDVAEAGDHVGYALGVNNMRSDSGKLVTTKLKVNGVECLFLIDSGASVNVVDCRTYSNIRHRSVKSCSLRSPSTQLYAYGSRVPLPVKGKFQGHVISNSSGKHVNAEFFVVKHAKGCLLSFKTASDLGIVKILNSVQSCRGKRVENILRDYDCLFHGLGKLKDIQLKLNVDETIDPVHQKHRRVPFKTRDKLEAAIRKLYDEDICEDVGNDPTPWVSPVVFIPKPNDPENYRLCVDMRAANKAIKRVKHPMPTADELIHDLNGCKVFSKLDLNQGYHQIELHPDSRYITTFSSHLGLHRYKRLSFGINAASEKFQHIIEQVLQGLPGVRNISDDIYVASMNDEEHEIQLRACLQRLKERGLTLNKKKCSFFKPAMHFFGSLFSEEGVSPDPRKVKAIVEVARPVDKPQVKSLLGMANYLQRYIPDFASIVKPLRELTKQSVDFKWTEECENAFDMLKGSLSGSEVMSYFDPGLVTELVVDASPIGLGCMLTQKEFYKDGKSPNVRVVAYASRALSDVESRYSQIEREALAVCWGIEHFHLYLFGLKFTVVTDHKPLVSIFSSVTAKPSARIERWCLRLQQYTFNVVYRAGANNPADYMSRHPLQGISEGECSKVAEEYVNYICEHSCPKALTLQQVKQATDEDNQLQNVKKCINTGQWHNFRNCEEMMTFQKIANDLCATENGVLLRGNRIIIPVSLRRKVVDIAHEGHQGLVKTKSLLREKVWFPGIDSMVEEVVKNCRACASVVKDERMFPLQMSDLPDRPWQFLSADFCGPYPSGDYCLVVIDEYSRFPVVELVKSTSNHSVIPVLDKIFATHGMPDRLKTDNGPPFQSYQFRRFMEYCGIKHRRITPLWPRSNAQSENFMKPLNKAIKSATVEGKSWKQELYKFLRNYRATPHTTTGKPPAEVLFGSNIKILLPEVKVQMDDIVIRERDAEQKAKQKMYADQKNCNKPTTQLHVGDMVLMRQERHNKLTPAYDSEPMIVTDVKGTMITAQSPKRGSKTRNASLFKKIHDGILTKPIFVGEEEEQVTGNVPKDENVKTSNMDPPPPVHVQIDITDQGQKPREVDTHVRRSMRTKMTPARFKDFYMGKHA